MPKNNNGNKFRSKLNERLKNPTHSRATSSGIQEELLVMKNMDKVNTTKEVPEHVSNTNKQKDQEFHKTYDNSHFDTISLTSDPELNIELQNINVRNNRIDVDFEIRDYRVSALSDNRGRASSTTVLLDRYSKEISFKESTEGIYNSYTYPVVRRSKGEERMSIDLRPYSFRTSICIVNLRTQYGVPSIRTLPHPTAVTRPEAPSPNKTSPTKKNP